MLSLFPNLFTYELIAPLILRVIVGFIFLNLGYLKFKKEKEDWVIFFKLISEKWSVFITKIIGLIEIIGGIFLIIGFLTQGSALFLGIITFLNLYVETQEPSIIKRTIPFYLMLVAILCSLLFLGPGFLSIDLPL